MYLTYNVNVLIYKPKTKTIDDFIYLANPNEISPQFIKFIAELGTVKQNIRNEFIPTYQDYFYKLEFNLCNTNKTKGEKQGLLNNNSINIIWVDSPITSIEKIASAFNSYNTAIQYSLVIIYPETETHYHIKVKYSKDSTKMIPLIQNSFLSDYIININSKNGILYFINNLISLCEWDYLNFSYQECSNGKQISKYMETNFSKRFNHLDSLCNGK